MSILTEVRDEEREARRLLREQEREARERERQAERRSQSKLADIIRDELSKPRAKNCRCGLRPRMSRTDLIRLGEGCTHSTGLFICPVLDAVRRRMDR